MATNFAKDMEREIGALEAQRVAAQEQVETIDKKIKYLRGLQELYAPPAAKREKEKAPPPPGATRVIIPPELGGPTGPTGAAPTPEQPAENPPADQPPAIATTVMSVQRPSGPAATVIPSDGPVRPPTVEQMRGSR